MITVIVCIQLYSQYVQMGTTVLSIYDCINLGLRPYISALCSTSRSCQMLLLHPPSHLHTIVSLATHTWSKPDQPAEWQTPFIKTVSITVSLSFIFLRTSYLSTVIMTTDDHTHTQLLQLLLAFHLSPMFTSNFLLSGTMILLFGLPKSRHNSWPEASPNRKQSLSTSSPPCSRNMPRKSGTNWPIFLRNCPTLNWKHNIDTDELRLWAKPPWSGADLRGVWEIANPPSYFARLKNCWGEQVGGEHSETAISPEAAQCPHNYVQLLLESTGDSMEIDKLADLAHKIVETNSPSNFHPICLRPSLLLLLLLLLFVSSSSSHPTPFLEVQGMKAQISHQKQDRQERSPSSQCHAGGECYYHFRFVSEPRNVFIPALSNQLLQTRETTQPATSSDKSHWHQPKNITFSTLRIGNGN